MIVTDLNNVPSDYLRASAVTVGNFDGVHLGHRAIIGAMLGRAKARSAPSVVVTFDPHPREVLSPGAIVPAIVPFCERVRLIEELGVEHLLKVEFTLAFAARTAEDFVRALAARVHPAAVVIGHDFRFGRDREGDDLFLRRLGPGLGFEVMAVSAVELAGEPVSSTRIRAMIQAGQMRRVRKLLGAPFSVVGQVVHGHHRGRGLGFATANLRWEGNLIPAEGVYAAMAYFNGHSCSAVANIGSNPTFGDEALALEAHLLGFDGDLYAHPMRIAFHRRLRGELKFESPAALVAQIKKDVAFAREVLDLHADDDLDPFRSDLDLPAEGGPA
jgi:riboflavin kinase / FMN adenylyltransferase